MAETQCKRCNRTYTPEEDLDLGICCICFRDLAYTRVFGDDWRAVVKVNFDKVLAADTMKAKLVAAEARFTEAHTVLREIRKERNAAYARLAAAEALAEALSDLPYLLRTSAHFCGEKYGYDLQDALYAADEKLTNALAVWEGKEER